MLSFKCPVQPHPAMCICPLVPPVIHRGDVSFYTGASALRLGTRLYATPVKLRGAHLVRGLVRAACYDGFAFHPVRTPHFRGFEASLYLAGQSGIMFRVELHFVPATLQVRIIQRAVRRFLDARRALHARRQALLLSTHPRLGSTSPFASLPLELFLDRFGRLSL